MAASTGPKSLRAMASDVVLENLRDEVDHSKTHALFTCSGKVSVEHCESVTLRWDSSAPLINKLELPSQNYAAMEQLLKDCQPASFGYMGQDVLDESYRKAKKMEPSQFSCNFNPYELGIVDTVQQMLYPCVIADPNFRIRRVRAELYKLNVYSGPSGMFKAHVDTPRAESQFGSLVVCLPFKHQGGDLVVRHEGRDVVYNWSTDSKSIQWAAFYSDCEHEVSKVHSGHRITLTYNLYDTQGAGGVLNEPAFLDSTALPLHNTARILLEEPSFFTNGGVLGFWCSHAYAHIENGAEHVLPRALKGVDMAVYRAFTALNTRVLLRPVYLASDYHEVDWPHCGFKKLCDLCRLTRGNIAEDEATEESRYFDGDDFYPEPRREGSEESLRDDVKLVGTDIHPQFIVDDAYKYEWEDYVVPQVVDHCTAKNIVWLNNSSKELGPWSTPKTEAERKIQEKRWKERMDERADRKQPAVVALTYGNNASLGVNYSMVALFICIPPFVERYGAEDGGLESSKEEQSTQALHHKRTISQLDD